MFADTVEVDNQSGSYDPTRFVSIMNLAVVCPHKLVMRVRVGLNHPVTNDSLGAALTSATEWLHTQILDEQRPFEGADVTVELPYLAVPGQFVNIIRVSLAAC